VKKYTDFPTPSPTEPDVSPLAMSYSLFGQSVTLDNMVTISSIIWGSIVVMVLIYVYRDGIFGKEDDKPKIRLDEISMHSDMSLSMHSDVDSSTTSKKTPLASRDVLSSLQQREMREYSKKPTSLTALTSTKVTESKAPDTSKSSSSATSSTAPKPSRDIRLLPTDDDDEEPMTLRL